MQETKLIAVFLFSSHLAMMECDWNLLSLTHGIRKFLSTPLPIWTTNITEDKVGKPRCEVDLLLTISKTHITYRHLCYEKREKKSVRITGRFDERKRTRLFIHINELNYNISEEMVYLNWIQKCAVFMVTAPYPGRWHSFDVRVWNSSIEPRNYGDCIRKFKKLQRRGLGIYSDYCQNIVYKRAKLPILHMKSEGN
uniref:Lipocalin n=1 Tax=Rhipicephalus zambeziensis TaxID=60191 RepID=A0A224YBC5_9ACAR